MFVYLKPEHIERIKEFNKRGFVVIPTAAKKPEVSEWQKLTESVPFNNSAWLYATGFGFVAGKASGFVVVDIDKPDMDWAAKMMKHHNLKPTTTVLTPSGGLHFYYKYDGNQLKQTQNLQKFAIDIRNDKGYIMSPYSPYDTKKEEKMKFNGIPYMFAKDADGVELNFDKMAELDQFWLDFQNRGMDRETFEFRPAKAKAKAKAKRTRQSACAF